MATGVNVTTSTAPPARGNPVVSDTLFLAGPAEAGAPTDQAYELRSIADFEAKGFGARDTANAASWDYLDVFFREGGRRAYFSAYTPDPDDAGPLETALERFTDELGPGQVAVTGAQAASTAAVAALGAHALSVNRKRVVLIDVTKGADTAAQLAVAGVITTAHEELVATFGDWLTVPAPAGVVGAAGREVPLSAGVAGLIARADALGNVNRAAAGSDFPFQFATGFVRTTSNEDRETLLDAGVNPPRMLRGVPVLYGFQTALPETSDNPFWQLNCARARAWLVARGEHAGEPYVFRTIDGRGLLASALASDLAAVCLELYAVDGLYGETPEEAFSCQVAATTDAETARGVLNSTMQVRLSPHAKAINISLVSIPVTGRVS